MSKKNRLILLNISLAFAIIALARPIINRGEIKVKQEFIDIVVAFDISRSMFASDIYPNRLEFSKKKFFELLDELKEARVGVVAFSSRAFLVSPITNDFHTLKYLVKNLDTNFITLHGTDIMQPLEVANSMIKGKKKILVLFTDGGDSDNYDKEIAFAKKNRISVFVDGVATEKGTVIKDEDGLAVKDRDGNIVITKLNPAIAYLAKESGGAFVKYSLGKEDIKVLAKEIKSKFSSQESKDIIIKDKKELFYYPLLLAITLFIFANSSLPSKRRRS
jgi:Ca-activated chloride channel family protein